MTTRSLRVFACHGLALHIMATPAPAETQERPDRPAHAAIALPSPEELLTRLRGTYLGAPWADRVVIAIREPGQPTRRASLVVRCQPSSAGVSRLLLDFGRLTVFVSETELIATTDPPKAAFVSTVNEQDWRGALAGAIPATPLPQIDLALADGSGGFDLGALGSNVRFSETAAARRAGQVRLIGSCDTGAIECLVDVRETDQGGAGSKVRLRELTLTRHAEPGTTITLTFSPLPAGDPGAWHPATDGLPRVASVAELISATSGPKIGERIDLPSLTSRDGTQIRVIDLVGTTANDPRTIVLLYARTEGENLSLPPAATSLLAADWSVPSNSPTTPIPTSLHLGLVAVVPAGRGSDLAAIDALLAACRLPTSVPGFLAWSASPAATIDLFEPDASAVLLVLVRDASSIVPTVRLSAVIPFDDRADDMQSVVEEVFSLALAAEPPPSLPGKQGDPGSGER